MIRLRNTDGTTIELPDSGRFVEITDVVGDVAVVLYQDDDGIVHAVRASDPEAARYTRMFHVKWCDMSPLPEDIFETDTH
jgi:hypothetical protein